MRRTLLFVLCTCFAVVIPHLLFAQHCDKLTNKSGKEAFLSYLENYPKENLGQDCVAFAIKGLANDRNDERAARILSGFLDYYWKEPGCENIQGGRCSRGPYPAMNSLMEIGNISQPYVLEALESDSISQVAREYTVDVYYYFIREDPEQGIATLKWEADRAADPKVKERLLWAASALAKKWCYPFKRFHNCDTALAGTLPFDVAEDTQGVYEAVIPKEPSPRPFADAIANRTVSKLWSEKVLRTCINHRSDENPEFNSAISDFIVRNRTPELLGRVMRARDKPYVLLDATRVAGEEKLRASAGIAPNDVVPDRQYGVSGPLISVSRVGFSKNGAIAIVYVQHECFSGCSGGAVHVLRRHANFWLEEARIDCD